MSTNYGFEPTLDGLNSIESDTNTSDLIEVNNLIIINSGISPTMPANNNSLNIANTAYVTNALSTASSLYVTISGDQTITSGIKTFTNLPKCTATVSNNADLTNKLYVDNNFINIIGDQTLTTGTKTFTVLPQSTATPTNNSDLTNKLYIDNNFINLIGNQTLTSGIKTFTNLPQSTATPTNNSDLTTKIYIDNIVAGLTGAYVSLTGNQTISNIKTFNSLPQSSATPTNNSDFVNKLYVDNVFTGSTGPSGAFVTITGDQTLTSGIKTFTNLPQSTATPTNNSDLTTKIYTDNLIAGLTGTYVKISGNQTISDIKTFSSLPQSTATPSNNSDLVNKLYIDNLVAGITGAFVTLTGNQVLGTGIKTFTDLPDCTGIPSNNADLTNKLYVDNLVAGITGGTGVYVTVTGNQTINDIKTFNSLPQSTATPTNNSDLVNKLYTDNIVAGLTGAYMSLTGSQSVSGIKTYSTKQIFNLGTACNTYDATGITDMTLASNNGNKGILTIAGGRIITDTYGVTLASNNRNLQLGDGTFIQPINQDGLNDYSKPTFVFSSNRSQGYTDITGVPNSAQATRQINILQGISSWFAGYNQTTTFTISHSIFTTSSTTITSMNEAEVVIYFQDFNTGIVRYTTPNLATTTGFSLPANSTVIRPLITFTLTTAQLPEGEYLIMGYSRVTNAYVVNTGVLTVNFSYAGATSSYTSIQNYNTPTPSTFTSRNLYHCFRNTAMCGVYIINNIATQQNIMTPIHYSISDFTNMMSQPSISGALTTPAYTGQTVVGNFVGLSVNNADNYYLIYPNYSIILYNLTGWGGTIYLNYKNSTNNPVTVAPSPTQSGSSCRIYFDEVELIKY
jgi:hypothetical protein